MCTVPERILCSAKNVQCAMVDVRGFPMWNGPFTTWSVNVPYVPLPEGHSLDTNEATKAATPQNAQSWHNRYRCRGILHTTNCTLHKLCTLNIAHYITAQTTHFTLGTLYSADSAPYTLYALHIAYSAHCLAHSADSTHCILYVLHTVCGMHGTLRNVQ